MVWGEQTYAQTGKTTYCISDETRDLPKVGVYMYTHVLTCTTLMGRMHIADIPVMKVKLNAHRSELCEEPLDFRSQGAA